MLRTSRCLRETAITTVLLVSILCVSGCMLFTHDKNVEKVYIHKTQKGADYRPIFISEDYYNNLIKEDKRDFEYYGTRTRKTEHPSAP